MNAPHERQELRKRMRELRNQMSPTEHRQKSTAIVRDLTQNLTPQSVGFCLPIQNEVDILPAILFWQKKGVLTAMAKVVEKSAPLRFLPWREGEGLKKDACGILSPEGKNFILPEILLVPFLAMDEKGFRLGYGGGYFDRTFAAFPHLKAYGVGFEEGFIKSVFPQPHDIPLFGAVTEQKTRIFPR